MVCASIRLPEGKNMEKKPFGKGIYLGVIEGPKRRLAESRKVRE